VTKFSNSSTGTHTASYNGKGVPFSGGKATAREADRPPPFSAEVKNE